MSMTENHRKRLVGDFADCTGQVADAISGVKQYGGVLADKQPAIYLHLVFDGIQPALFLLYLEVIFYILHYKRVLYSLSVFKTTVASACALSANLENCMSM
jgi:hypothetical protein